MFGRCLKTGLAMTAIYCLSIGSGFAHAQEKEKEQAPAATEPAKPTGENALRLEEPPALFVPARPDTVESKKATELAELFVAARAHEVRRQWTEALVLLDKCAAIDPENLAVLKRQSRLNLALGQVDKGLEISRKVLTLEPGDVDSLRLVVGLYERRGQLPNAEKLLADTLANPKLDQKSPAALYAHFARGMLFAGRLQQPANAVEEMIKVMDLLDDKQAGLSNSAEANRILGGDPSRIYFNFGRVFAATQRWDQAARAFEHGLGYNPDDPMIAVLLITSLLEAKKPEAALAQLESAFRRKPEAREIYEMLPRVLTRLNRKGEVVARLESLSAASPNNPGIISVLADEYRDAGMTDKAKTLYEELIRLKPDPQGFGALASSMIKDKKYDGFLDLLAKAMTNPRGLDSLRPQLESLAVAADQSAAVLDAAIKRLEADPKAFQKPTYNSLFYLARQSDLWDRLVKLRGLAAKADPSADSLRELALTHYEAGNFAEAAKTMQEIIDKFPDEKERRNLVMLAQFQVQAKLAADALKTLEEALKSEPNDPMALRFKIFTLSDLGRVDEALTLGKEVLAKAPEDADFNRVQGAILTKAHRDEEAISFYRDLLKQYPANDELAKVAHSGLSVIYVNRDDFANGEKELEQLLKRVPDDVGVNNDLGYLYADQGKRLEEAEAMIRKAVAEDGENSAYLDSLAWVLYKRGQYDEALRQMEKAIAIARRNGPDGTLFDHLGDILFRLKKFDKAREAWNEGLKHIEPGKSGEKLAESIKMKLGNLDRLPAQVKVSGDSEP
jgi:tetratricopeptide (TPR) repeat protein